MAVEDHYVMLGVILLVIVFAIVGGYGLYLRHLYVQQQNMGQVSHVTQQSSQAVLPQTPQVDQTAGWRTYKSDIFDYEIKLPVEYKVTPGFVSSPHSGTDIDYARYTDDMYFYSFEVFARNEDFIVRDCLKDLAGNDITKTKQIGNSTFYVFNEKERGTGNRMALALGGMKSEYNILHNGSCYIVSYVMTPNNFDNPPGESEADAHFETLDKIFSTFKFTK